MSGAISDRFWSWVIYLAVLDKGAIGHAICNISQKGIVWSCRADRILVYQMVLYLTNSNNYSFGNHFFKVLVQIHYSQYRQLSCSNIAHQLMLNFTSHTPKHLYYAPYIALAFYENFKKQHLFSHKIVNPKRGTYIQEKPEHCSF